MYSVRISSAVYVANRLMSRNSTGTTYVIHPWLSRLKHICSNKYVYINCCIGGVYTLSSHAFHLTILD